MLNIILAFLFAFNLYAQENCSALFQSFPKLESLDYHIKSFPSGKTYRYYKIAPNQLNKDDNYQRFLQQTVEVLFEPSEPFGHLRLRVGHKQYSFNYIQSTSQGAFRPPSGRDYYGFIYMVDSDQILKIEDEIGRFYSSSAQYNIPPFDAYSPPLKIRKDGGRWRYESPSESYANNGVAEGEITRENGKYFLKSSNFKMPIRKLGEEEFEVLSYSCVSSTSYWLEKFGLRLNPNLEAKGVKKTLLEPRWGASEPDMIFQYFND
jgi:hypothetical protein